MMARLNRLWRNSRGTGAPACPVRSWARELPVGAALRWLRCVAGSYPAITPAALSLLLVVLAWTFTRAATQERNDSLAGQSEREAASKSSSCVSCHTSTDEPTMHPSKAVHLGCTDCHGGDPTIAVAPGTTPGSRDYNAFKQKAHVPPHDPVFRERSAMPERVYTAWLKESPEYIKFRNPGDLRVAPETCGPIGCHPAETRSVSTSMMTHAGLLWGAALYNNGAIPYKNARFGESYSRDGQPQLLRSMPAPSADETRNKGVLAELTPLYRWEVSQPGNILRVASPVIRSSRQLWPMKRI